MPVCCWNCRSSGGSTGSRSAAAARCSVRACSAYAAPCSASTAAQKKMTSRARRKRSDTEHHDLGGFDERGHRLSCLELHFARGVRGDNGGNDLSADGELDLREQPVELEFDNTAHKLITP